MHARGDLIECDGLFAAVVALAGEPIPQTDGTETVPDEHLAIWYGDPAAKRISQGGTGGHAAIIYLVPADTCVTPSNLIGRCEH